MKRIFSVASSVALLSFMFLTSMAHASFSDVPEGNAYFEAVGYAEENGIVSGYPDGSFKATNRINRAEFTKIVVGAALDYNSSTDPSGFDIFSVSGIHFSDISGGQWYNPYLRKALEHQIIAGYPDGTFKPAQNINFAEAAKIIVNSFEYNVGTDSTWYKPYVEKLAELKAIPSTIKGFDKQVTRGEMVEMIYRLHAHLEDRPSLTYSEVAAGGVSTGGGSTGGGSTGGGSTGGGSTGGGSTGGGTVSGSTPHVGDCSIYPADNPWNRDVSNDPVDSNSNNYISYITDLGGNQSLHPDFGGDGEYGIPYIVVGADEPLVPVDFIWWPEQSDPGPYPIPGNAPVEGGSDAHVLAVDQDNCKLYELYASAFNGSAWEAGSGAVFDLTSNTLRPEGWTSADAAGLPIFPGLVRYDEVAAGEINHAIRVTFSESQHGYIHPATHFASDITDPNAPPMGLRLRLKADYDISGFTGQSHVILEAMKKYGLIMADNGSNWFFTGSRDTGWDDEDLNQMKSVPGSAFEVVSSGEILQNEV